MGFISKYMWGKVSFLFLFLVLCSFFIPVSHTVHCMPLLSPETCVTEQISLGFYIGSHVVGVLFQLITFELTFFFTEMLYVTLIFLIFLILGNCIMNFLLSSKLFAFLPLFMKKTISSHQQGQTKKRSLLLNIALFFVMIILVFALVEASIRIFTPAPILYEKRIMQNETLGWVNKPNLNQVLRGENGYIMREKHDSLGLRSEYNLSNTKKTKKRVLVLGDSFVYGVGLNTTESMPYFLQQELGNEFEVLNGGVSAYSTWQEFLWLKEIKQVVQPDFVLLGIYSNDLKENIFPELKRTWEKPIVISQRISFVDKGRNLDRYILNKSTEHPILIFVNKQIAFSHDFLIKHSKFIQLLDKNKFSFLRLKEESFRHSYFLFSKKQDAITHFAYQTECAVLKQLVDYLSQEKIPYLFFYIPAQFEIEQELVEPTFAQYYDISEDDIDLDRPQNELFACAKVHGFRAISLKPVFLAAKEQDQSMYNKYGHHWSPTATNLTAQVLKKEIIPMLQ